MVSEFLQSILPESIADVYDGVTGVHEDDSSAADAETQFVTPLPESTNSFTLSGALTSFQKTAESYAENAYRRSAAVFTNAQTYWKNNSVSQIAADAGKIALRVNPITAPVVAAYEAARSPAVQKAAKSITADAVKVASEYFPEETATIASAYDYFHKTPTTEILADGLKAVAKATGAQELVAEAVPYLSPFYSGAKELVSLLSSQPEISAAEPIVQVAAVEKTTEKTATPRSTAAPVSPPIVAEEETNSWSSDYDYSVAGEEEEVTETDAVAEEDVAPPVVTAPAEETVVVAQAQTAPAEVKKEEAVAEKTATESKTVVVAQTTTEPTNVTSSEDEGFASSVEYAAEVSTLTGMTATAGQAVSPSGPALAASAAATEPRQKINLPSATVRETIAVADGGEASERNGVGEKVSKGAVPGGVSVEEKREIAVADAKSEKSVSTTGPSSVVSAGGLTSAERAQEHEVQTGVADARFVQGSSPGTVVHKDSSTTDSELGTVADNLNAPLNDVPDSGSKGFDSDGRGKDSSVESIYALADAGDPVAEEEIFDADVIESFILPSDVVV